MGLGVAMLVVSSVSHSQEAGEPLETGEGEVLVVTANRVEQSEDEVAGYLTVITKEEIEMSAATTLDELLRSVPGFSLFRRASSVVAHPTTQGVSLRGIAPSGASRALVLLDGVPLNDAFGGWVYWGRVALARLEQVEILRGGVSNVWGNYALSGVINLSTRPIEPRSLAAAVEVGNHDDLQLDLFGSRRGERFGWALGVDHFQTDGYPVVRQENRGAIDIAAFSEQRNLSSQLAWEVTERLSAHARLFRFDEERGNGTPLTNNDTATTGVDLKATSTSAAGGVLELTLFGREQAFASTFSAQEADRTSETPALDQFAVDASDLGAGVEWTERAGDRHLLSVGSDLRWIDGETNELFFWDGQTFLRQRRAGGEQRLGGAYLQDVWGLTDSLQLTSSVRFDVWENLDGQRTEFERVGGAALSSESFPPQRDGTVSPRLAVLYWITDRLSLRSSAYRSFRAPTINELYRPFRVRNDITAANADLAPEVLTGAEIGVDARPAGLLARLTLFWNRVDDPIANVTLGEAQMPGVIEPCGFVPAGGSCRQRRNLGATRVVGLESEVTADLSTAWRLSGSYLHTNGEVVDAPIAEALEGKRLAQVPPHQLTVSLDYQNDRWLSGRLETRYLDEQFEDDLNSQVLDDALVVDLSLVRKVAPGLEVRVRVQNLLDEEVEVGVDSQGLVTIGAPRQVFVGARFSVPR